MTVSEERRIVVSEMAVSEVVAVVAVAAAGVCEAIQSQILSRTTVRVPSKQRTGALGHPESYPAPLARGILSSSSDVAFPFTNNRLHCNIEVETCILTNC